MTDINKTLDERQQTHGSFESHARISQALKDAMQLGKFAQLDDTQREALEMQKSLTEAEVDLMKAKTERIKSLSDEAMITVNGDGLKPHLEMIMWEIFEAIQIRATQEGLDKLLLGANA